MKINRLDLSSHPEFDNHHSVTEFICDKTGLHALIAIHNLNLGPALGGCRFYPYMSTEQAITDVLRLSKGMTYKSALARLALGGGKSVIIGDPKKIRTPAMMQKFGEAIESLKGNYITAEDVGSHEEDMIEISKSTSHVAGLPDDHDPSHVSGNPSPITALGTFYGLKAAVKFKLKRDDLKDLTVSIQGMGAVGRSLADHLLNEGTHLLIADMNNEILTAYKSKYPKQITIIDPHEILKIETDIVSPCAMGGIINQDSIKTLKTKIIAGAANNQLNTKDDDKRLFDRDILYAPDYAINSGGITSVGYEYFSRSGKNPYPYPLTREHMLSHVQKIEDTMLTIFEKSRNEDIPCGQAANQLAEQLFQKA